MSDNKLDKIDAKLDKLQDKLSSIDVTLAAQHESLKTHIKRTDLLEEKVHAIEKDSFMNKGMLKFIGLLAVVLGIVEGIMRLVKK